MKWRRAERADIPAIRRLWELAKYGFQFPDLGDERIISSWIAEENGEIICWSGAQLQPEVISIMDPDWGSPHQRLKLFGSFHRRIAEDVREKKFERAFCTTDPKFPRFGEHLRDLGWLKGWDYLFTTTQRILGKR